MTVPARAAPSRDRSGDPPAAMARYLRLAGAGDEQGALDLVTGLLEDGMAAETILLQVIGTAQARVGQMWADNRWSVAREHATTAIGERAVAAVSARSRVSRPRGRVTVACVDGEWHALPARIVAEVLRLHGWRTDYLGANVPTAHLVTHLHRTDPDAVALSCMLPTRLPRAHVAITACQAAGVPVLAGGRGFGADGRHARLFGARGWAPRADAAAEWLAGHWPPREPEPEPEPEPVPYSAPEEYAGLARRRPVLIETTLRRLVDTHPHMAAYDDRQRDATVEDLGHIADFLAAAVYVDDATVFTDFVAWTAGVLAARRVPAAALLTGLEVYRELLPEHPRAGGMLTRGIQRVRSRPRAG